MEIIKKGLILKTINTEANIDAEGDLQPLGLLEIILPKVEKILEKKATSAKQNCAGIKRIIWKNSANKLEFDFTEKDILNVISVHGTIDKEGENMIRAICFDLNANYYDNDTGEFYYTN